MCQSKFAKLGQMDTHFLSKRPPILCFFPKGLSDNTPPFKKKVCTVGQTGHPFFEKGVLSFNFHEKMSASENVIIYI